jgi:RNA polymerase sigma factor (sigma-70 family)
MTTKTRPSYAAFMERLNPLRDELYQHALSLTEEAIGRALGRYERHQARGDSDFSTWMYSILERTFREDCQREVGEKARERSLRPIMGNGEGEKGTYIDAPITNIGDMVSDELRNAILWLPEKERRVFEARALGEWTELGTAQYFGISVEAVRKKYSSAQEKLRKNLFRFAQERRLV